jgi:hypothetical protein
VLDASQSLGETVGPVLAGLLWQTGGGVVALFSVRIVIALVAEVTSLYAFGEMHVPRLRRPRASRVVGEP